MQEEKTAQTQLEHDRRVRELSENIASLKTRRETLIRKHDRQTSIGRLLGKSFGFGPAGKLEWLSFMLRFREEELALLSFPPVNA
ncbi:MAG: hypothetical protein ACKV2V_12080 [Blastocatellia bacterium]